MEQGILGKRVLCGDGGKCNGGCHKEIQYIREQSEEARKEESEGAVF